MCSCLLSAPARAQPPQVPHSAFWRSQTEHHLSWVRANAASSEFELLSHPDDVAFGGFKASRPGQRLPEMIPLPFRHMVSCTLRGSCWQLRRDGQQDSSSSPPDMTHVLSCGGQHSEGGTQLGGETHLAARLHRSAAGAAAAGPARAGSTGAVWLHAHTPAAPPLPPFRRLTRLPASRWHALPVLPNHHSAKSLRTTYRALMPDICWLGRKKKARMNSIYDFPCTHSRVVVPIQQPAALNKCIHPCLAPLKRPEQLQMRQSRLHLGRKADRQLPRAGGSDRCHPPVAQAAYLHGHVAISLGINSPIAWAEV